MGISKEAQRIYNQKYKNKNRDRIAFQNAARQKRMNVEIQLRRKGLDPEKYADYVRSYEGGCQICGKPGDGRWSTLNIDHCHKTLTFRGLLCTNCNHGLGKFGDDPEVLRRAAAYLEAHQAILKETV